MFQALSSSSLSLSLSLSLSFLFLSRFSPVCTECKSACKSLPLLLLFSEFTVASVSSLCIECTVFSVGLPVQCTLTVLALKAYSPSPLFPRSGFSQGSKHSQMSLFLTARSFTPTFVTQRVSYPEFPSDPVSGRIKGPRDVERKDIRKRLETHRE